MFALVSGYSLWRNYFPFLEFYCYLVYLFPVYKTIENKTIRKQISRSFWILQLLLIIEYKILKQNEHGLRPQTYFNARFFWPFVLFYKFEYYYDHQREPYIGFIHLSIQTN